MKQEFQIGDKVYILIHNNNIEKQTITALELNEDNNIEYITNKGYIFTKNSIGQEIFRDKKEASSRIDNSKLWISNNIEKQIMAILKFKYSRKGIYYVFDNDEITQKAYKVVKEIINKYRLSVRNE